MQNRATQKASGQRLMFNVRQLIGCLAQKALRTSQGPVCTKEPFMTGKTGKLILIAPITLFASLAIQTTCIALPVDLGTAGPGYWSVLEVGSGTVSESQLLAGTKKRKVALSNLQGGIMGNVGVAQDGHISGTGPQFNGDLYLGNNASAQFSGTYANNRPVTGTVHLGMGATIASNSYSLSNISGSLQPMLNRVKLDAMNAATAAAGLSATSAVNQINLKRKSMTLAPGVYDLASLQLKRATLTLSGSGSFVFNISSVFALKSAHVLLAGGATEANVLFNYTGTNNVLISGGKKGNSALHGIILALNASVNLAQGLVVGEIISGKDISMSRAMIQAATSNVAPPFTNRDPEGVPEGTSTFALSLIALGALAAVRSFLPCNPATRIWANRS